eukprot:SAG11_NODE_834_length_6941_cov_19.514762_3_plen_165_part_00
MVKPRILHPKPLFDEALLLASFEEHGIKPLHAKKIWTHLLRHPEAEVGDVPGLPQAARALLEQDFARLTSTVKSEQRASDGTIKLLIQLQDGMEVEAVVMIYDATTRTESHQQRKGGVGNGRDRATLCVSSQVGCKMGCTFCATGTMGKSHADARSDFRHPSAL